MENEIISKRTERCKYFDLGNGKRQYVGFGAPCHYKNSKDEWEDIVIDFKPDGLGNLISDKNKISCGFRTDGKLDKYFGLRYDYEHQFEASLYSMLLDTVEQVVLTSFSVSATAKSSEEVSNKLNTNVEILSRLSEVALRNYYKVNAPINNFQITEQLHLAGLSIKNKLEKDKYIPDENGDFIIVDEKGEFKFGIHPPFFVDVNGKTYNTVQHELSLTEKGLLLYTKTPTKEGKDDLILCTFPIEIDADTFYTTTKDGYVESNSGAWATIHDESTGADADSTTKTLIALSNITKTNYFINRAFLYFDTSSIGSGNTVTNVVLSLYATVNANDVSVQLGTQADTLTTGDIDSFSGGLYTHLVPTLNQYNDFTLGSSSGSQGCIDINTTGTSKLCIREYTYDYLNTPAISTKESHFYSAEEDQSGERRPKLVVTYETPTLIGESSTHVHKSDEGAVIQAQTLIGESSTHVHKSDEGAVIQAQTLIGESSTHVHKSDEGAVTASITLIGSNNTHIHISNSDNITQRYIITGESNIQIHISDFGNITQGYIIIGESSTQIHISNSGQFYISLFGENNTHKHYSLALYETTLFPEKYQVFICEEIDLKRTKIVDEIKISSATTIKEDFYVE